VEKMAQFAAESVAHITAECLDQFAPERVAHFAAESVAGLLRNMQSVHKFVTRAAVGMANDGEYVKEFTIKQQLAYKKFSDAKFEDYRLGDDHSEKSVRILYLEAVLLHKELCSYQCEKMSALTFMLCKSMAFRSFFTGTNFIVGVGSGIVASILFTKLFGP
jgi:hypothetical protein